MGDTTLGDGFEFSQQIYLQTDVPTDRNSDCQMLYNRDAVRRRRSTRTTAVEKNLVYNICHYVCM